MTREQLEAIIVTSALQKGRASQYRRVYGIEDYLFIGGDRMSAMQASLRIGRSQRTIVRWRKALREAS